MKRPRHIGAWQVYGQLVRMRRMELGLTCQQVADRMADAGVPASKSSITKIELGDCEPMAESMLALNYALYGDATYPGAMIPTLMAMGLWKERR